LLDSVATLDNSQINEVLRLHLHADMAELGLDQRQGAQRAGPTIASKGGE
jgi:hypothetical protein